jgi:hypothetical protein
MADMLAEDILTFYSAEGQDEKLVDPANVRTQIESGCEDIYVGITYTPTTGRIDTWRWWPVGGRYILWTKQDTI